MRFVGSMKISDELYNDVEEPNNTTRPSVENESLQDSRNHLHRKSVEGEARILLRDEHDEAEEQYEYPGIDRKRNVHTGGARTEDSPIS